MKKIQIILGSTREGRNGEKVAQWFYSLAKQKNAVEFEMVDLRDWPIPFITNPNSPMTGQYDSDIVKQWSAKIDSADAFVFVVPEYNHGYSAVLKNALDVIYKEWNNKPAAFVSYGATSGGMRAVEQLRQVFVQLELMPIHDELNIPLVWQAFDENGQPVDPTMNQTADVMLEKLISVVNT